MQTEFFIKDNSQEKGLRPLKELDYQVSIYPGMQVVFDGSVYVVEVYFLDLNKGTVIVGLMEQ